MGRLYPQFQAAGAEVLVILGASPARARQYGELLRVPFPILADPERAVYHRFGLEKAYLVVQRSAVVVVDKDGFIRYLKQAINPMRWLIESEELLRAVQRLGGIP